MERTSSQLLTEMAIDVQDRLALREFAELSWQPTGPGDPSRSALMRSSPERRYSWMRTMQSRGRPLPRPVAGSTRSALYRLGDLADWVKEHGPAEVVFDPDWALWRAGRAFVDEQDAGASTRPRPSSDANPLDGLRRFLVGVVLLCAQEGDRGALGADVERELRRRGDDLPARLGALADRGPTESAHLAAQLIALVPDASTGPVSRAARAVGAVLLSGEVTPASLVDLLFEHLAGLAVRAGTTTTGQSLARLVSVLGDPQAGEHVVDPACGEGQLLLAAARLRGAHSFVGRDSDGDALLTARAVLMLNGIEADLGQGPTDSLAAAATLPKADLVLLDPPLGRGLHVARWLRLAADLAPAGRVVVVLTADSLRAGRREWSTVADRVVAVVACPAKLRTDTGDAPAVWVLGPSNRDTVLVVDASSPEGGIFDVAQADRLADAVNAWSRAGWWDPPPGVRAMAIPRREIDAAGGELRLDQMSQPSDAPDVPTRDVERTLPADRGRSGFRLRPRARKFLHLLLMELTTEPDPETEELRTAIENYLSGAGQARPDQPPRR